jgi:hypothetical protein
MTTEEERRSFKAVRSEAARLRLRAMRSQLTAALRVCSSAENALVLGQIQLGHDAISKARNTVRWVREHLEEPNHVPPDSVAGIQEQLAQLEKHMSELEAQLFQSPPGENKSAKL